MAEVMFTDEEITGFLKQVIEIGDLYYVEDSPDKIIRMKEDDSPVTTTVDGVAKSLALYGTKSSEVLIVNPFVEGELDSVKNKWFYSTRNIILGTHLAAIMHHLINVAVASKKKKGEDKNTDLAAIELLSSEISNIDEKMVHELKSITNEITNFFNIYWNKSLNQCEVKCLIYITSQRKAFSSIRVKTWNVFENLMSKLLGTNNLGDFTKKPTCLGAPVLETFLSIFVEIYSRINPYLKMIGVSEVNVSSLKSHLNYIGNYAAKARWCTSIQPSNPMPNAPTTPPWQQPLQQPVPNGSPFTPMTNMPMYGPQAPFVPMGNNYMTPMPNQPYMAPSNSFVPVGTQPAINPLMAPMGSNIAPVGFGYPTDADTISQKDNPFNHV